MRADARLTHSGAKRRPRRGSAGGGAAAAAAAARPWRCDVRPGRELARPALLKPSRVGVRAQGTGSYAAACRGAGTWSYRGIPGSGVSRSGDLRAQRRRSVSRQGGAARPSSGARPTGAERARHQAWPVLTSAARLPPRSAREARAPARHTCARGERPLVRAGAGGARGLRAQADPRRAVSHAQRARGSRARARTGQKLTLKALAQDQLTQKLSKSRISGGPSHISA